MVSISLRATFLAFIAFSYLAHDIADELSEFRGVHCNAGGIVTGIQKLVLNLSHDSNVVGYGAGRGKIVTGDQAQVDGSITGLLDDGLDGGADWVFEGDQGEEGLVSLKRGNFVSAIDVTLHLVHNMLELADAHILVRESHGAESYGGHLFVHDLSEDRVLVLLVQGHFLRALLETGGVVAALVVARAVLQHNLWSSFDIDADGVGEEWVLDGNDRSLQFAVEWDLGEDAALFLSHYVVDGDLSVLEPLDEGDLSAVSNRDVEGIVSHLDVSLRVVHNALNDLVDDCIVELAIHQCVLARVKHEDILGVEVNDFHLLSGHGAGLAEAEISDESNLLDGVDIADEDVVVLVHEENAVRQTQHNCHWEAFGDGDNEHDEGDRDVGDELVHEDVSANVLIGRRLDEEDSDGDAEDDEAGDEADELETSANVVKLACQFS